MDRDGSEVRKLADGQMMCFAARFSPDRSRVLAAFGRQEPQANGGNWHMELLVIDPTTGKSAPPPGYPSDTADNPEFCWSPDGRRVAYTWGTRKNLPLRVRAEFKVVVCDLDGGGCQTLVSYSGPEAQECQSLPPGSTGGSQGSLRGRYGVPVQWPPISPPEATTMKSFAVFAVLAMTAVTPAARAADLPAATDLPAAIEQLKKDIRGQKPNDVLKIIDKTFGKPSRDLGSGVRIPQWDTDGGQLTYHPHTGVTWRLKGKTVRLVDTHNPVGENVLRGYEMTTPPLKEYNGTRFWMGNLALAKDGSYAFTDSESNTRQRGDQSQNFFMQHPKGSYELKYPKGITAETLLEGVDGRSVVAELVFTSADKKATATFAVISTNTNMRLEFSAKDRLAFELEAGWAHYWK